MIKRRAVHPDTYVTIQIGFLLINDDKILKQKLAIIRECGT